MQNKKTLNLVLISVLSALGFVLMLVEIPYPLVPFLKLDISDSVVLVAGSVLGIVPALIVTILKSLLHFLVKGPTDGAAIPYVGQFAAIIASATLLLSFNLFKRYFNRLISLLLMVLTFTVVMVTLNYFLITPIYFGTFNYNEIKEFFTLKAMGMGDAEGYLATNLFIYGPFNLIKGFVIATVFYFVGRSLKLNK